VSEAADSELEQQVSAELVRRIGAGDRAAEAEMVRRYSRGLMYVLRRRTADQDLAQDLAQDTFRIALERLRGDGIDQRERLAGFLYSTARNLLIAHQRKEWRRATVADSEAVDRFPDDSRSPFQDVSRAQVCRLVRRLLEEMHVPRDREILVRVYVQDQDKDEICRALKLDSVHFNRVLHRAKGRFRQLLEHAERRSRLHVIEGGAGLRSNRGA
jgi:RNA polymerase sigma-70 factor, ECF subfamily